MKKSISIFPSVQKRILIKCVVGVPDIDHPSQNSNSVICSALIDTGAMRTCISSRVADYLTLLPTGTMRVEAANGHCDHLFYQDPDKYFTENLRIETLRNLAKRFVNNTLGNSTYKKSEEMIYYPESWLTTYSWGEKKAIWVFKCQVTSSMYFHIDGTPDKGKLDELKTEISTGLWDNYLLWTQEAYDNLVQGSNLTNKFLQMAVPQQSQSVEQKLKEDTDEN